MMVMEFHSMKINARIPLESDDLVTVFSITYAIVWFSEYYS